MDTKVYQITKLNGSNYFLWKIKIEMLLQREKVWNVIEEDSPETVNDEWRSRDQCARATIGLTLEDNILVTIANCRTAKSVWYHLKSMYEHKGLASQLFLLKKLYSLKYGVYRCMEDYLNSLLEIIERLRAIGEEVKEHHIVAIVLCGLPANYNSIITALETKEGDSLKLDYVMERLRDEAMRQESPQSENGDNTAMLIAQTKRRIVCYHCDKVGHIRRNCPQIYSNYNNQDSNRAGRSYNSYYSVENTTPMREEGKNLATSQPDIVESEWALRGMKEELTPCNHSWLLDSGASCHMSPFKENFNEMIPLDPPIKVKVANGDYLVATSEGNVDINISNYHNNIKCLKLRKVLYIPNIDYQLLSIPAICDDNCEVHFSGINCNIYQNDTFLCKGKKVNKSYVLDGVSPTREVAMPVQSCIHRWHERLGHRAVDGIHQLARNNQVRDLEIDKCTHDDFCEPCKLGAMKQISFPSSNVSTFTPFKKLVMDLCGPITPCTLGGKQYMLTMTDDATNFTQINLLKHKNEAAKEIINFIEEGKNLFGYCPEIIRSDEGGEFVCCSLDTYLKHHGIKHQTSVTYTPQQNGKAERKNQTIMNMTRSMLKSSGLPKELWGEAATTATYILNRVQHSGRKVTPYEGWFGHPPSVKHLRVFGCKAYAHIPKVHRKKLDDTSTPGFLVGYGVNKKCYRVWVPGAHQIINTISVKFNESDNILKSMGGPEQKCIKDSQCSTIEWTIESPEQELNTPAIDLRRSSRPNKGIPAVKLTY